jgi:hypothetical protein
VGYGSKGGSALKRILLVVVMAVLIVALSAMPALALTATHCQKNGRDIVSPLWAIQLLENRGWTCSTSEDNTNSVDQNVQDPENGGDLEDIGDLLEE